ncbi:MAG: outer membrane protein assembly factor BamB family protein [Parvularcula sp.]
MIRLRTLILCGAAMASLAGCSSNPIGNVFSRGKAVKESDSAAAGEADAEAEKRIPVLALATALEPDPKYASIPVSIPPAFANSEWSQPGGEPDHVMHHLSGPETYALAWRAKVGIGGSMREPLTAPPVVADRHVFTIDAASVVKAFSTEDGSLLWTTSLTPELKEKKRRFLRPGGRLKPAQIGFGGGVSFDDGRLFVANGFAEAAALDMETGEVLWETRMPAPVRNPPTAANGQVFVLTTANQIVALDQLTGETQWTYESFEENARFLSTGSPAIDGDIVVAPFSSGEVVALDSTTGRLLWTATVARSSRLNALSNLNDIAGSPVIDRGGVFAVSHSGQLSAIDGRTGRVAWEASVAGLNMPWVAGDFIFLVSVDGKLVNFNRADGGVVWAIDLPAYEKPKKKKKPISWFGPLLVGERLIVTSSAGEMLQVDPQDGEIMQRYKLAAGSTIPPVVADGTIYVIDNKGQLEAWR